MSVVLNHPINGHSATSVDPDYVVFPAAQEIVINSVDDSISIGDPDGHIADVTPAGELVVIGTVTVNNASGASAVNIQDGGNSITIDGSVSANGTRGSLTDRSGTATTTSAVLAAANANRSYFFIQNISGAAIWINFGTAAVADSPSIRLDADDSFTMENNFISTQSINVIAASATRKYVAKEG